MGFRFRRSVRIMPGLRLNFGKRGVSVSAGPRGAKVTVGPTGTRATVGIPGTGISYTEKIGGKTRRRRSETTSHTTGSGTGVLGWFVVYQALAILMYGSLFAAIGAACTDIKETQTLTVPLAMLACLPMFLLKVVVEEPQGERR